MRPTIGRMMLVVFVAACVASVARHRVASQVAVGAMIALAAGLGSFVPPVLRSRPGHRLVAAARVAALWPLAVPAILHAAWASDYALLGHPPGPADNGFWIEASSIAVGLTMGTSVPATIFACLAAWASPRVQVVALIYLTAFVAWVVAWGIVVWDPARAMWWFLD